MIEDVEHAQTGLLVALHSDGASKILRLLDGPGETERAWTWSGEGPIAVDVIWQGETVGHLELWTEGDADKPRVALKGAWNNYGIEVRLRNADTGEVASMMAG